MRLRHTIRIGAMAILLVGTALAQDPNTFYVNPVTGSNTFDGRSWQTPFADIIYAVSRANQEYAGTPWTIQAADAGVGYRLDGDELRVTSGITLVGVDQPLIDLQTPGSQVVAAAGSTIRGIGIQVTHASAAGAALRIEGAADQRTDIENCQVYGHSDGSVGVIGIDVVGGTADTTTVVGCFVSGVGIGLRATGSGVAVARTTFQFIGLDAVQILALKQSGVNVPLMGEAGNIEKSGVNTFRNVTGFLLNNATGTEVVAQVNDWGLYSDAEITSKVSGNADTTLYLGKGIGPGSLVASVQDSSGSAVPQTANPACSIPALSMTATYDSSSQKHIFSGVSEGTWSVQAVASGYSSTTASATVSSMSVSSVTLSLSGGSSNNDSPCGGKNAAIPYAASGLVIWVAGRRKRAERGHPIAQSLSRGEES